MFLIKKKSRKKYQQTLVLKKKKKKLKTFFHCIFSFFFFLKKIPRMMSSVYPPSKMSRSKEGWGHLKKFTRVGGNIFFFFYIYKKWKKDFHFSFTKHKQANKSDNVERISRQR